MKKYGTGSLYLRDQTWWFHMYVDGKSVSKSTKCKKESDAKRFRDQMIAKRTRNELGGRHEKVLVSELLDDVLNSDIADSTRKNWKLVIEANLRPFFGSTKASRVTTTLLEEYREKRVAQGRSHATANRELCILRTAYNNARKRTPPKVQQCPYFPMREETNIRTGFLLDEIYPKLRDALTEPEIKLLYVIAYHTGIRKNELLQVRWTEVDLEAGYISLNADTTKNGEARQIPVLPGDMMELLTDAKQFRDENFANCPWVFHRSGKKVTDFRTAWKIATKLAGVGDLLFHDLRRTAVRNMRRDGVSQAVRMKISGHKTDSMERRYNIIDHEDLEHAKLLMGKRKS
jgi:integrase